jgi:imidazolonepropionase-like amidohydrolase
MKRPLRRVTFVVLITACTGSGTTPDPETDLVMTDVTVIDGTGAAPRPGQTVEVTDGRITAVRATVPGDSATVEVTGSFVLPGLIDTHVHLPADREGIRVALDSLLDRGITSARDMACCAPDYASFSSRVDSTDLTRLYWSAFWAGPTYMRSDRRVRDRYAEAGHVPWLLAVTDTTDLEAAAEGARASGATGIKIYSDLERPLVRAAARAARESGLRVWSHAVVFPTRPSDVVESGVDVVSHAAFFVWEARTELPRTYNGGHPWSPFGPPAPYGTVAPDDDRIVAVLETMRDRGVILEPTISVMEYLGEEARAWAVDLTRLAHGMEIPISTGTDAALLSDEIEALVRDVGLDPSRAVESATSVGAAVIGEEEDLGSVEVGKIADLVVYPADPTGDITVLRKPSHVIKNGELVRPPF